MGGGNVGPGCGGDWPLLPVPESVRNKIPALASPGAKNALTAARRGLSFKGLEHRAICKASRRMSCILQNSVGHVLQNNPANSNNYNNVSLAWQLLYFLLRKCRDKERSFPSHQKEQIIY